MGFGRFGERVAKTPMRLFPPSRGGRTVGDQSPPSKPENCHKSHMCEYLSRYIAIFRLENDFSAQLLYNSALPRQPEFFGKIGIYFRYRAHYPSPPDDVSDEEGGSGDELSEDEEDGVSGCEVEVSDEVSDGVDDEDVFSDEVTVDDDPEEDGAELLEDGDEEEDSADEEL